MSVGDILTLMGGTGGGVGLIMLALFISGQIVPKSRVDEVKEERAEMKAERDEWKRAAETERLRAEASVTAATVVRDVMIGLHKELNK